MKNSLRKAGLIFCILILCLFILFSLLNFLPASAHLPVVEDKENYIPALGWIKTFEGDAKIKTQAEGYLNLSEGQAVVGSCEIKTSDNGSISITLEDYDQHQSVLTVNPNTKVKISLSEGKHFDDTISMKWYIDPHQVTLKLEEGNLNLKIITDEDRYDFSIKTPNAKVEVPKRLKGYDIIDFFVSLNEKENIDNSGHTNRMQDFLEQLQDLTGEEIDEETAEIYSQMMEDYTERLNEARGSGYKLQGEEFKTRLEVYQGEVKFQTDTDSASSNILTVNGGEIYVVDGINKPLIQKENVIINPGAAEKKIKTKAFEVIQTIKCKNFDKLADYVHPEKGLRFTPYTHVDLEEDVVMTQEQVSNFFNNDKKYLWGVYDGSGTPIILTPAVYYDLFIYTQDFFQAEEVRFNKPVETLNTYENHYQIYENPIVVEYYFSGFNPRFEGMDWESLRLVFEEYEDEWKLVGIIHNQWTI